MTSPFSFSAGAVLTAAQLNAIGNATDTAWTPSWNNFDKGSGGANEGYYMRVNDLVVARFRQTLGTSPTIGSVSLVLPVTADYTLYQPCGQIWMGQSGGSIYNGQAVLTAAGTCTMYGAYVFGTAAVTINQGVTASTPFSWGSNDYLTGQIVYRAA